MEPQDLISVRPVLWRIHRTQGSHVRPWNELRTFGPLASGRFDPHPPPAGEHPGSGVLYAAQDLDTALAEVYQLTRSINTSAGAPQLTSWTAGRSLRLLDLTGTWALRNQSSAALAAAPRQTCRTWARAVRARWPDLDGLLAVSTMTGSASFTLWEPARDSLPALPEFTRPLGHPLVWTLVQAAAQRIGYGLV